MAPRFPVRHAFPVETNLVKARLADALFNAEHPTDVLTAAVGVLGDAFGTTITICDADDLEVLASSGEAPAVSTNEIGRILAGKPVTAINMGSLTVMSVPNLVDEEPLRDLFAFVLKVYERVRSHAGLVASEQRLRMAQELAHLGSYDWEIQRDLNTWSDELFRIYGTEPQSFHPSYDRFIAFIHPDDRERILAIHQQAYQSGQPYEMEERIIRPDGTERILSSNGIVIKDDAGTPVRMTGICWDVTDLRAAEQTRMRLHEAERARKQSLEINDSIVQNLALAAHCLEAGDGAEAAQLVGQTLYQARRMAGDLLEQASDRGRDMNVLTRSEPIEPESPMAPRMSLPADESRLTRVLVADDTAGMRALIREFLSPQNGFVVVGEAATGKEAIELAEVLRPDLIILDLSMPEMDGMRAIPEIRHQVPGAGILVLSGYGGPMVQRALDAGAHAYIEKGAGFEELVPRARAVADAMAA